MTMFGGADGWAAVAKLANVITMADKSTNRNMSRLPFAKNA
jgi:hypothetical protein